MITGPLGLALIKSFEICKLVAYQDSDGIWTIGYGHTGDSTVKEGDTCTQEQADAWLAQDLGYAETDVNELVKVPLTQNEFDALVSFTYNVGYVDFKRSTLLKLLNQRKYAAAGGQLLLWNKAGGVIIAGLVRRRKAEFDLYNTD